ncbi:MAG TPA: hypothetical protein VFG51_02105 [Candidatus Saccharimonadia bacterium]|nr:hypothetical protein [Candidatus Saccharimonadia bacterium]
MLELGRRHIPGFDRVFPRPPIQKSEAERKAEAAERWRLQVVSATRTLLSLFSNDLPYFENPVDSEQTLRMALEYYAKSSQYSGGVDSMIRVPSVPENMSVYATGAYGMINASGSLVANVWGEVGDRGQVTIKYVMNL